MTQVNDPKHEDPKPDRCAIWECKNPVDTRCGYCELLFCAKHSVRGYCEDHYYKNCEG